MDFKFRIYSCQIETIQKATELNRVQRLVCRLFNIEPEQRFWYVMKIKISRPNAAQLNDIVVSEDGDRWIIYKVDENNDVFIRNLEPIFVKRVTGEMAIISNIAPSGM